MATLVINYSGTVNEKLLFAPVFHRLKRDAGWCWLDAAGGAPPSEDALQSLWLSLGGKPLRLILLIDPEEISSPPKPLSESHVASCWVVVVDPVRTRLGPIGIPAGAGEEARPGVAVKPFPRGGVLRFPWPTEPRDQAMQLSYLLVLLAEQDFSEKAAFARVEMELDSDALNRHFIALRSRFRRALEMLAEGKDTFTLELLQEPSLDKGVQSANSGGELEKLSFSLLWRPDDRSNWDGWLASAEKTLRERRSVIEKALGDCTNNLHTLSFELRQEVFSIATLKEKEAELQRRLETLQQSWQSPGRLQTLPTESALWSDLSREYTSRFEEASRRRPALQAVLLATGVAMLLLFSGFAAGVSTPHSLLFAAPALLLLLSLFGLWLVLRKQYENLHRVVQEIRGKVQEQIDQLDKAYKKQKKALEIVAEIRTIQRNMTVVRDKREELHRVKRLTDFHRELFLHRLGQVEELLGPIPVTHDDPGQIDFDPFRREIDNACYDGATDDWQTFILSVPAERREQKRTSPFCPGLKRVTFSPRKPDELFGTSAA